MLYDLTNISLEKYLLALRCLNAALKLNQDHPRLHEQAVQFQHVVGPILSSLPPKVQEIIKLEFTIIPPSTDLKKLNSDFRAKHKESTEHAHAAIRAAYLLGQDKASSEKELVNLLQLKSVTFAAASNIIETLKQWGGSEVGAFKKAASEKWPNVSLLA